MARRNREERGDRRQTWRHAACAAVLGCLCLFAAAYAQSGWLLMSRHGECHDLSVLKRRFADLPAVETPQQFVEALRRRGLAAAVDRQKEARGLVTVDVPDRHMSLIFVRREHCTQVVGPR